MKLTKNLYFIIFSILCCLSYALACTTDSNCNNGKCKENMCVCDKGFITFQNVTCNYQQKEKLTAFLLSFLAGKISRKKDYIVNIFSRTDID